MPSYPSDPADPRTVDCDFAAIHYTNDEWIFTTDDWQGAQPKTPAEIPDFEWRIADTQLPCMLLDGLPRFLI